MRRPSRGFSLVELLVVIGIIAALIGILLPVLARARQMARSTTCLANLQQWGASFQMYVNNNRGHCFADMIEITSLEWWELLQPFNGDVYQTLLCPEATDPGNAIGGASQAWGPEATWKVGSPQWIARDVWIGSYGINGWLYDRPAGVEPFISLPATQSDRIPVFADCIVPRLSMPRDTDTPPANLIHPIPEAGSGQAGPRGSMADFCIDRHRRAVNVIFLDGHADRVPLADLWKLKWNTAFHPRDVVIPP